MFRIGIFDKLTVLKFYHKQDHVANVVFRPQLRKAVVLFCDNELLKVMMYKNVQKEEKH